MDPVKPDFCEDFSSYTSTAELHSDPHGWLWWWRPEHIDLVSTAPPGQSRSVRYTYHSMDDENHVTPKGRVNLAPALGLDQSEIQEVWIEVKLRFSSNFTIDGHPDYKTMSDPPAGGFKLLHTHYHHLEDGFAGPNRFQIAFPYSGSQLEAKQGGDNWDNQYFNHPDAPRAGDLFDGSTWHVIRQRIRIGPDSRNLPHLMEFWLNGQYQGISKAEYPGSGVPYLYSLEFGVNMNRFPPADQYIWWSHIKIWQTDPGW